MDDSTEDVQRLMFAVIHRDDVEAVRDSLNNSGYRFTRVDAQGGFLRRGNSVFMVGVHADQVDDALEKMRAAVQHASSRSDEGSQYGVVFVVRVDAFARL